MTHMLIRLSLTEEHQIAQQEEQIVGFLFFFCYAESNKYRCLLFCKKLNEKSACKLGLAMPAVTATVQAHCAPVLV